MQKHKKNTFTCSRPSVPGPIEIIKPLHYSVRVTKVTDNKIIPPLGAISMTQCLSETSSYQDGGQGYGRESPS